MSALLALLIFGCAVWFVVVKAGVGSGSAREPMDSVSEFARAMTALDPTASPVHRQAVARRPAPRRTPPRAPSRVPGPLATRR
ncbi:MAG TPA: hypothetical protein VMM13_20060 [Euzebya sp.]|nr:hypothetical protein [Euzebya sp.]